MNSSDTAALPARQRILQTAHDLFYRDGIRATGIDRVIAEAKVTKVTFYRSYPSKNDLIHAFLAFRHERWMAWLREALARHQAAGEAPQQALLNSLAEWWQAPDYRGCAFINSAAELGGADPQVLQTVREHKGDMTEVFTQLLPEGPSRAQRAQALTLAVDGAIVHAQMGAPVEALLQTLGLLAAPLFAPEDAGD